MKQTMVYQYSKRSPYYKFDPLEIVPITDKMTDSEKKITIWKNKTNQELIDRNGMEGITKEEYLRRIENGTLHPNTTDEDTGRIKSITIVHKNTDVEVLTGTFIRVGVGERNVQKFHCTSANCKKDTKKLVWKDCKEVVVEETYGRILTYTKPECEVIIKDNSKMKIKKVSYPITGV